MGYSARIERHSISPEGIGLMTAVVTFPRVVIAEVVTHRRLSDQSEVEFYVPDRTSTLMLSKSSASSRAIPISKMIQAVMEDPYIPEKFSRGGKGMQESGWLEGQEHDLAVKAWLAARDNAVHSAKLMIELNVHKQDCNRLLEPWAWVTQIITGDQFGWSNFFALRTDAAAMPAFRKIARKLYLLYRKSVPEPLEYGQWHAPFLSPDEVKQLRCAEASHDGPCVQDWTKVAAARCARVSYNNHEGKKTTLQEDLALFSRLLDHMPRHAAPAEAVATPMSVKAMREDPTIQGNFTGWMQLRKTISEEYITNFTATDDQVALWEDEANQW